MRKRFKVGFFSQITSKPEGSRKGSGFHKTASTTLKMAVVAPRPNARAKSAAPLKPGALRKICAPYRKSGKTEYTASRLAQWHRHSCLCGSPALKTTQA